MVILDDFGWLFHIAFPDWSKDLIIIYLLAVGAATRLFTRVEATRSGIWESPKDSAPGDFGSLFDRITMAKLSAQNFLTQRARLPFFLVIVVFAILTYFVLFVLWIEFIVSLFLRGITFYGTTIHVTQIEH